MADVDQNTLLLVIIAILLPPLAVGLKAGFGGTFVLNLILPSSFGCQGCCTRCMSCSNKNA